VRSETKDDGVAPVIQVMAQAERLNAARGDENLGHLSFAHGFMPAVRPLPALPARYAAWDDLAAELPRHFRDLSLRRRLDALPVLDAEADALPDAFLLRAATVLGMFAHAYTSVETFLPRIDCPDSVRAPWRTVRRRLDRAEEVLTYVDNIVYNWRLLEPSRPEPMRLDNLRLLVPTVDTPEERVFYLTQVEILARATPIVRAIAAAQTAVLADDRDGVRRALGTVAATLRELRDAALPNIDPRPSSPTFQNPVVWAKSVAPLSVPIHAGLHGPSGTNSPIFAALDVFFERPRYATVLGQEMAALRLGYPRHWRDLLTAVAALSVRGFVERRADPPLTDAWNQALSDYAGPAGFLARHRLKVYGYMEVAFRIGRSVTIGGFAGRSNEKVWRQVDRALELARRERLPAVAADGAPAPRPAAHDRTPAEGQDDATCPPGSARSISVAELARHNDDQAGYWMAIGGEVYDVTAYLSAHPGGPAVLALYAGTDATEPFARVHGRSAEVARLRAAWHLGRLRTAPSGGASEPGSTAMAIRLTKALYATTAVQNSLRLDLSFQEHPAQCCEARGAVTAYKLQRLVESHQRFFHNDLPTLRDALRDGGAQEVAADDAAEEWPPSSARAVVEVLGAVATRVSDLREGGRLDALATVHSICADMAARQQAAVAEAKAYLLEAWQRWCEGAPAAADGGCPAAVSRLASYLRPLHEGAAFEALQAIAAQTHARLAEAAPLWSDHELMRARPHGNGTAPPAMRRTASE